MPYDAWVTIVAALIGAVIGSLGAALAAHLLERSSEKARTRSELAQRYLFQVQDSVESLWFRLANLEDRDGGDNMPEEYYVTTMLYAVGRVLACERLLALEGAYFTIEEAFPQLGEFLKGRRIDHRFSGIEFFHYNRLALAETMLRWEEGHFRPALSSALAGRPLPHCGWPTADPRKLPGVRRASSQARTSASRRGCRQRSTPWLMLPLHTGTHLPIPRRYGWSPLSENDSHTS